MSLRLGAPRKIMPLIAPAEPPYEFTPSRHKQIPSGHIR
jgi:hypothetical protein